jgi:hypothetical protein
MAERMLGPSEPCFQSRLCVILHERGAEGIRGASASALVQLCSISPAGDVRCP